MSGGWAAKELCERGLKVLVLERGRAITPDDYTDNLNPWDLKHFDRVKDEEANAFYSEQSKVYAFHESTKHFWVKDSEHPYETEGEGQFSWRRGYHLGGRSVMWARMSYRFSPYDFEANKADGIGVDWPIRYDDLAPWYDHVETFAGISGSRDGIATLPDGQFLPPFDMTCAEEVLRDKIAGAYTDRKLIIGRVANLKRATQEHTQLGRGQCQARNKCFHGCSYGAYFSSLSATLPAAQRTGNLTVITDAIVQKLDYDPKAKRVSAVHVVDAKTKTPKSFSANIVFLNASAIASAAILLNSKSEAMPTGLANRSDQVGRNIMDHVGGSRVQGKLSGHTDKYYYGRRPVGGYIPRYRNYPEYDQPYKRGFAFQVYSGRDGAWRGRPGIGQDYKQANREPGPWRVMLDAFGEVLPDPENRMRLHPARKDAWGMPVNIINASMGENERALMDAAHEDAKDILTRAGFTDIRESWTPEKNITEIGGRIHEMGTARMGRDAQTSVLNAHSQAHDVKNLFITDGSAMTSSAIQNPSLTYMALSARAANYAADLFQNGDL